MIDGHEIVATRLALAHATADRLEAVLAKTRIVSPIDGVVIARSAEAGHRSSPARRS